MYHTDDVPLPGYLVERKKTIDSYHGTLLSSLQINRVHGAGMKDGDSCKHSIPYAGKKNRQQGILCVRGDRHENKYHS